MTTPTYEDALLPSKNSTNPLYAEVIRLGTQIIKIVNEKGIKLNWAVVHNNVLFIPANYEARNYLPGEIWLACTSNIFDRSMSRPSDNPVIGGEVFTDEYLQSVIDRLAECLAEISPSESKSQ